MGWDVSEISDIQMEESLKTYHTFLAKRILITETVFFAVGIPVMIYEPIAGIYYYVLWFSLVALINVIGIAVLLVKRPQGYVGYCIGLLVVPMALAAVLFFVIRGMIN